MMLALISLVAAVCQPQPAGPDVWASRGCKDDRSAWFRDAKFGAFIHFGLYSQLGGYYEGKGPIDPAEQIMGLGERRQAIPWREYRDKVGGAFNPSKFDARAWARAMKGAGQKYVILTAKHHDGFCMWRTRTTGYNVVDATPFKRDVVGEMEEACRAEGLEFCIYYSIGDWAAKDVMNPGYADYRAYMQAQIRELLTGYTRARALWFDNWWYVDAQWTNDAEHAKDLYTFARTVAPSILVNDRCGTGVKGDHGDYTTPENQLAGSKVGRYFEVVMTNTKDDNWGWVKGATNYRSADEVILNLIDSASKGGNYVLNVGPTAEGELPAEHLALLKEVGAWTARNGRAIYGTEAGGFVEVGDDAGGSALTTRSRDGRATYVFVTSWPKDGQGLRIRLGRSELNEENMPSVAPLDESLGVSSRFTPEDAREGWLRLTQGATPPARPAVFEIHRHARSGHED